MSRISGFLILFFLTVQITSAADTSWDERLAGVFSGRLEEIEIELKSLAPKLVKLEVVRSKTKAKVVVVV